MDHLASCYFCGTAMDRPLQRYRVVPVELRDDDAVTTATLCPACHGKLERLLAPVVEATGIDGATLDPTDRPTAETADGTEAGDRTETRDGSPGSEGESGVDAGTAESGDHPGGGGTSTESPDSDLLAESELDRLDSARDPTETDGDRGPDEPPTGDGETAEESGENDDGESDDAREKRSEADRAVAADAGATDGNDTEGGADADAADGNATGGDTAGEGGDTTETEEMEVDPTAQTTVSALEYNKVMRLLQNREFPVDRTEIETVAANAYGLARSECASVIDLAIDRGLIEETDGELVRTD
jgi:hypothetical protein